MSKTQATFSEYVSGKILTNDAFIRRLPLLAYVSFLMMVYMANNFSIQAKYDRMNKLTTEIKLLRTISVTASAVRMAQTRQSEVAKLLQERNMLLDNKGQLPKIIK